MNRLILFGALLQLVVAAAHAEEIMEAYDAVQENKVSLSANSVSSYQETRVEVENNTDDDLNLRFSSTGFMPGNDAQRIGVTRIRSNDTVGDIKRHDSGVIFALITQARVTDESIVRLAPHETRRITFESRCLDHDRPAPRNGLSYKDVIRLPQYISVLLAQNASQAEVWQITDTTKKRDWKAKDPRPQPSPKIVGDWRAFSGSNSFKELSYNSDGSFRYSEFLGNAFIPSSVRLQTRIDGTWSIKGTQVTEDRLDGTRATFEVSINDGGGLVVRNQRGQTEVYSPISN